MGLFSSLFSGTKNGGADDPLLDEALERAAARVEPAMKQARGWPRHYRRPILAALTQARRVAETIPGPVEMDAEHFTRDPFVHALFASPDVIRRALCSSEVMRQYVASDVSHEVFVLLSMRREEKKSLGIDDSGGVLRRDVPQRSVWFADHRLHGPAPTLEEARSNLVWMLFDRLLERVAVGVERIRAERDRLAQEKDLAMARLRGADPSKRNALQTALEKRLKQLGDAMHCLEHDNLVEVFNAVLSHPEDCLFTREQAYILDGMGVVRDEPGQSNAVQLTFVDLYERDAETRTVALVHCRDIRPMTRGERLDEAVRWLG